MKLVRFRKKVWESYGVMVENRVLCLPILAEFAGEDFPKRIEEFIAWGEGIERANRIIKEAEKDEVRRASWKLDEVTLLAPVSFPPKIICLGLNYRDHAAEVNLPIPDEPIFFIKPRTAIIGPNERIIKSSFVNKLDYEAELAIIIGKRGKNVPVSEAHSVIFGYTIFNDVSARDIQNKDKQWTRGKSFDTFAPIGPCIVTANQLDPSNLRIRTWVNGELRQNSTTQNMIFNVYDVVYHLSRVMTLEPCDIIATGTPPGVGDALKPQPKYLEAGDVIKIEIEGIGVLENTVLEVQN